MKRTIVAALLLGAGTNLALGQAMTGVVKDADTDRPVTVIYDKALSEEFEIKREIVERVKEEFGENAVFDAGQGLPEGLKAALVPGSSLPDDVETGDVPSELSDLPTLGEGTRWVTAGEHLVEVTDDNSIVMIVYDALP
jgi:hypothetical protein